jgi:hypothetical protein
MSECLDLFTYRDSNCDSGRAAYSSFTTLTELSQVPVENFRHNIRITRSVVHSIFRMAKYLQIKELQRGEIEIMAETALRVL